ncbi:hypothetical protein ATK17_0842 [Branchiibius hedensis]|uniref:Uncharacterized protein n=1 Tax=Branchiibius hedensis TaxID=672460 RepID=A0A2Y8ZQH6_9MICO|nr:hypothetical protein [Branchiibius hedensis]PWJ24741.1 hypothetical protein ATK17_0842 [Branchiibius hedensis]SSA33558.1 hypothetical protein SAMN04489750_0842 [Branchiibius hedensis]
MVDASRADHLRAMIAGAEERMLSESCSDQNYAVLGRMRAEFLAQLEALEKTSEGEQPYPGGCLPARGGGSSPLAEDDRLPRNREVLSCRSYHELGRIIERLQRAREAVGDPSQFSEK